MSITRAATLILTVLAALLLWPHPAAAAPVPVRFAEGVTHGFLTLRSAPDNTLIASGELLQVARDGQVESRMVFRFPDGSVWDENVVFTQERVFTMQTYRLVQKGPVFPEDTEISLERASGKYRVKTTARKDGREAVLEGTLKLPPDTYNGIVLTVAKNFLEGAGATIHVVAFTPAPRIIQLQLVPSGEHKVLVGEHSKTAVHTCSSPGSVLAQALRHGAQARPAGPPRLIAYDLVPTFVRFEGALIRRASLADRDDQSPLAGPGGAVGARPARAARTRV
jgi:hypothetical protein